MLIKKRKNESRTWAELFSFYKAQMPLIRAAIFLFLFLFYSFFVYYFGSMHAYRIPKAQTIPIEGFANNNYIYDPKVSTPEKIEIGISEKDMQKIIEQREAALRDGILITSKDSFVPAKIRYKGEVYRAKIRLKGDWDDHLEGKKWSFRVKLKDGDTLFGMREFSIMHPARRNYLNGWFFQKVLGLEGIINLRVDFIEVTLNRKNLGLYYMEEHFDKILIESNQFREGPILKFDESLLWEDRRRKFGGYEPEHAYFVSPINGFESKKYLNNAVLEAQFEAAYNLLYRFRTGELEVDQVFNITKLAKYYALADVLGAQHMSYFHNLRFYYNPITSRLEPIGFDADAGQRIRELLAAQKYQTNGYYAFDRRLFSDKKFTKEYISQLERFSEAGYIRNQVLAVKDEFKEKLNLLYKEFPMNPFWLANLEANQAYIRKALHPIKVAHAYIKKVSDDSLILRVANLQGLPVRITGVRLGGHQVYRPDEEIVLEGTDPHYPVEYANLNFQPVGNFHLTEEDRLELRLEYAMDGAKGTGTVEIFPHAYFQDDFIENDLFRRKSNVSQFKFIIKNEDMKILYIPKGRWVIDRPLIIPSGYKVVAEGGVTLDLIEEGKIISFSPVIFVGSEEEPIQVISSDRRGQGIAVMETAARSRFQHVIFKELQALRHEGWELTGAINFYEADVEFISCQFIQNLAGDDMLNIVRSDFAVTSSQFSQAMADAFDTDFSTGFIADTMFTKCGNDAMDFSGSVVQVRDVRIRNVLDKGISAGEKSEVEVQGVKIFDSKLGIVSKDQSMVEIYSADLENCAVGFLVYQKKPEFGPAEMVLHQYTFNKGGRLVAQQDGSTIIIKK